MKSNPVMLMNNVRKVSKPVILAVLPLFFFFVAAIHAETREPYLFGIAIPLTGSQALFGADQLQSALWAVEDINANGGINGRPLKPIVLDTQADPKLGISIATRLATVDKVPVFVTAWSSVVAAVAPVANREHVLCLSVGATSPKIARLGEYVYTASPLANVEIAGIASYSYNQMQKRRAAVIYVNNDTGLYAARVYQDVFKTLGGEIVTVQSYEPTATDFTGLLLQVKQSKPDVIHLQGLVSDSPQVIAQMRQLGIHQTLTSYQVLYNQSVLDQLGEAAGDIVVSSMAPDALFHPPVKVYLERWKARKGRVPNGLPHTQYIGDSMYVLKALYEWVEAKRLPVTGENLRRALTSIRTFQAPLVGEIVVNEDHTVDSPTHLLRVLAGRFTYMATIPAR